MADLAVIIGRGALASRPAAGVAGSLWYDTTNNQMTRDNGASWDVCEPAPGMTDATTTKGDLLARSASAISRLPVGTDAYVLTADSTKTLGMDWKIAVGGGTTPVLLLDYALATDTTVSLTQNAFTDFLANQTFTVAAGTSLVEVCVRGFIMVGAGAVAEMGARLVIDSAGTPINRSISGAVNPASSFINVLSGAGSIYLSGLAAGSHTVKLQIYTEGSGQSAYSRPVTAEPSRESLAIQVIEHK